MYGSMEAWERQCRMYNGTTTAIETKKKKPEDFNSGFFFYIYKTN